MKFKPNYIIKKLFVSTVVLACTCANAMHANAAIIFENEFTLEHTGAAWVIDAGNDVPSGNISLQFGTTLGENITFNASSSWFELSSDLNLNKNQLKNFVIDNMPTHPITPAHGQIYHNTTDGNTYIYNGATWDDTTLGAGSAQDFESVYTTDAGNNLITSNGPFTINTGLSDFEVYSNDWSVDMSGNIEVRNAEVNMDLEVFGDTELGDSDDNVIIDSSTWDITATGVGSGFTGFTSDGIINFSGSSSFRMREVADEAFANCTYINELVLDTTENIIYVCITPGTPPTGVWAPISSGSTLPNLISVTVPNVVSAKIKPQRCEDYATITVTGATIGDSVTATPLPATYGIEDVSFSWNALISAPNTVLIRACNEVNGKNTDTDDTQTWRIDVWQ
jgi:hypothetical protein